MNKRRLARLAGLILEDLVKGEPTYVQVEFMRANLSEEDLQRIKRAADTLSRHCKRSLGLQR